MKINNFLITLALCVGFSSIHMNASDIVAIVPPKAASNPQPPSSTWGWGNWMPSMPERVTNAWNSAKATYNSFTIENMKKQISSWDPNKVKAAFLAVVGVLLAAGYYKKDALIKMIQEIPQQRKELIQNVASGLGIGGSAYLVKKRLYDVDPLQQTADEIVQFNIDQNYDQIVKVILEFGVLGNSIGNVQIATAINQAAKTISQKLYNFMYLLSHNPMIQEQYKVEPDHHNITLIATEHLMGRDYNTNANHEYEKNIITQCINDKAQDTTQLQILEIIFEVTTSSTLAVEQGLGVHLLVYYPTDKISSKDFKRIQQ